MPQYITSQFDHPHGFLGRLVGRMMAFEHRGSVAWAVEQLGVRPTDRVIEVGFGPGVAIQRVAEMAREGFVAGVDISRVMVEQARQRNARAIEEGRVEIRQGSASALPYPDGSFDRALAIHTCHHWPDPVAGLREIRRVLKEGGVAAIVDGSHFPGDEGGLPVPSHRGFVRHLVSHIAGSEGDLRAAGDELARRLKDAGFRQVSLTYSPPAVGAQLCALAVK